MENIKNMELAPCLFKQECIKVEKKFFGFKTNVTYIPTNSPVVGICLEYPPNTLELVKQFITAKPHEIDDLLQKKGRPEDCPNGNILLSICFSKDRKFVALHLSQFSNFEYHSLGDVRFIEGDDAKKILTPFVK